MNEKIAVKFNIFISNSQVKIVSTLHLPLSVQ